MEPRGSTTTAGVRPVAIEHVRGFARRLLRQFDHQVSRIRHVLVARFGEELTEQLIRETRAQYRALIPRIPYIGGDQNPLSWNLNSSALWLAMWRVLERRGYTPAQAGELFLELTDAWIKSYPRLLLRMLGKLRFTRMYQWALQKRAERSQQHRYPGDFVYSFVEGTEDFDWGVDYTQCAILEFLREEGGEAIAPYLCMLDHPMSREMGLGLRRMGTLARGAPRCDFRFKAGRAEAKV